MTVRVCNTSNETVHISSESYLTNATNTEIVKENSTVKPNIDRADKVKEIIRDIMEKIAPTVDLASRTSLQTLLLHYEKILSTDAFDIGYTDVVKHRIDTADNKPVRE